MTALRYLSVLGVISVSFVSAAFLERKTITAELKLERDARAREVMNVIIQNSF